MATTFRADVRDGLLAVLDAVKAANPTLLPHTSRAQPGAIRTPHGYVDKAMPETQTFTANVWQRVIRPRIIVLNKIIDNEQTADEQDELTDLIVEAVLAAHRTAITGARIIGLSVSDVEVTAGDAIYAGFAVEVSASIQLGRTI